MVKEQSTREQVLVVGARLFRERGYERTTVRDLANEIGVRSGSVFYHFRTKEEILASIMQLGFERALTHVDSALSEQVLPLDRFRVLILAHLEVLLIETPDAMAVALREWDSLTSDSRAQLVPLRDSYEKRFQQVIAEAAEEQIISADLDLYRLFLLGALNWTIQWYQQGGGLSVSDLARRFSEFAISSTTPFDTEA